MSASSPFAPASFPDLPAITGVRLAVAEAGIRYRGRTDLLLAELADGTSVAGVFTRSRTAAAPVLWCRKALPHGRARALIVNAGNANAFTGPAGEQASADTAAAVAALLGCMAEEVYVASTGVIGEALPTEKLVAALPGAVEALGRASWEQAARTIATTDTFPKAATATAVIDNAPVAINGIVKGAGMIAPDMATMLAFVFTDANIAPTALQALVAASVDRSFNCITVEFGHIDQRHRAGVRDRRGRPCADQRCQRTADRLIPSGARQGDARPRAAGGEGRRGHLEVRHGQRFAAPPTILPRGGSASPSPTHRW